MLAVIMLVTGPSTACATVCFLLAVGEQENLPRLHDRADAHAVMAQMGNSTAS
jgi:hypothetical protein